MYDNRAENNAIGKIDGAKRRMVNASRRARPIPPLAERDCRDCAYAKVRKDGVVFCQQGEWVGGEGTTKFHVTHPSVSSFMHLQRLEAEKCPFFHPMTEE